MIRLIGGVDREYSPIVEKVGKVVRVAWFFVSVAVTVPLAASEFAGQFTQPVVALLAGAAAALAVAAFLYLSATMNERLVMYLSQVAIDAKNRMQSRHSVT